MLKEEERAFGMTRAEFCSLCGLKESNPYQTNMNSPDNGDGESFSVFLENGCAQFLRNNDEVLIHLK